MAHQDFQVMTFLPLFQSWFDGKNPECVTHSLYLTQQRVNKEHDGREVLSDIDVFNLSRGLIGAGDYRCLPPATVVAES